MPEWLGILEGYYGPALGHKARLELLEWGASKGFNAFAYAPKDDPFHREKWRDLYPDDAMREFEELVRKGHETGVEFSFTISPGLDWGPDDPGALIAKLQSLRDIGCTTFGVLWDDVPSGGTELGESHARGTAAAVEAIDGVRWWTVTTDYAVVSPTPYLEGFCRELPDEVAVSWTGSSVVPLDITGAEAASLGDALGRKLLLWENFPVNDGMMSEVLHLGPYPSRSPDLVGATRGVFLNTMSQPYASRLGLACGAKFWTDPASDREAVWRQLLDDEFAALAPLARACRSWVDRPGPSDDLVAGINDGRLRTYLEAGCRAWLTEEQTAELEPWLDAWDLEAQVMLHCLELLERGARTSRRSFAAGALWVQARAQAKQTFGIRRALYPVTEQIGDKLRMRPEAAVHAENLTDMLAKRVLRDE